MYQPYFLYIKVKSNPLMILIFCVSFLFSCTSQQKKENKSQFTNSERFADSLISVLNLKEKVGLLHGMGKGDSEFGDLDIKFFGIKGNKKHKIPSLHMGHGITGVRSGRDINIHATYFCTPIAMGCSWDTNLYAEVGVAIAKEMRALGQDLNLGPTLNIIKHPLGGRNWESFSEDPFLTSRMAVPFVKSMQTNGIICGPKHFVANNQEGNRFDINNEVDERTLREIYLPAFKAAVNEGGALNIMGAYNRLNGVFMCNNEYLLNDILRDEWGFEGFVLSDFALGVRNTVESVNAKMNVEMHQPKFYGKELLDAVNNGAVKEEQIDGLLKDVLLVMHRMDIFKRDRYENKNVVHNAEHIKLSKKVALNTPVLLKNKSALLPLDFLKLKSVAVIGPNAKRFPSLNLNDDNYAYYLQGGGSGRTYYFKDAVVDPFTGLTNILKANVQVNYAQGCQTPDLFKNNKVSVFNSIEEDLITEAVLEAKKSEVAIIFAGLSGFNDSEGWDRNSSMLPGQQNKLIKEVAKANSNTIVVLISGSYLDVSPWIDKVKSVLYVPYSGEQIGNGIADILSGETTPSGKLPFTWPKSIEDYPENSIFKGEGYSIKGESNIYSEGIFVGYRWFDSKQINVQYPFGFGLSYTQFKYSNLQIENNSWPIKVKVNITNTGDRYGAEITQVYVSDQESKIEKAVKELKGFDKTWLKPGESKMIIIELREQDFEHYDVKQKEWVIENGEFVISVGSSSRNLKISKKIIL